MCVVGTRPVEGREIIRCENVNKKFISSSGIYEVVRGLSLSIRENEFVVLFGPGQCGKTTILNLLAGLELPSSGSITVADKQVTGPDPSRGMVYQTTDLFPWLTVMGNVEFGPKVQGRPKEERQAIAQRYIDLVGLQGFENTYPAKLSGGMQQRVGIARAYSNDPVVILMDEPFGHLDAQTRYMMEEELEKIVAAEKRTVVFVTNNIEEAIYLADRILLLGNCPTHVTREYTVDLPRPRSYVSKEFLDLRETIMQEMEETL